MDSGLNIRPNGVATQSSNARLDAAVRDAVPTSLSPAQSVTAAPRSNDTRAEDTSNVRKIILDAHSREVISQVLDAGSGRVVRQMQEVAVRRLRAYTRYAKDRVAPKHPQADVEV